MDNLILRRQTLPIEPSLYCLCCQRELHSTSEIRNWVETTGRDICSVCTCPSSAVLSEQCAGLRLRLLAAALVLVLHCTCACTCHSCAVWTVCCTCTWLYLYLYLPQLSWTVCWFETEIGGSSTIPQISTFRLFPLYCVPLYCCVGAGAGVLCRSISSFCLLPPPPPFAQGHCFFLLSSSPSSHITLWTKVFSLQFSKCSTRCFAHSKSLFSHYPVQYTSIFWIIRLLILKRNMGDQTFQGFQLQRVQNYRRPTERPQ